MDIVYYVASSVDGYIATPDGGVDWLTSFQGAGDDHGYGEFEASVDLAFMGSRTYEVSKALGAFEHFRKPCWVFSQQGRNAEEPTVTVTTQGPTALVEELGARFKRAWLMGGGELASSFQRAGLITEYRIFLAPVLLGGGVPLFGKAGGVGTLGPPQAKSYDGGMVELRYTT